jgi:hypothetical protein
MAQQHVTPKQKTCHEFDPQLYIPSFIKFYIACGDQTGMVSCRSFLSDLVHLSAKNEGYYTVPPIHRGPNSTLLLAIAMIRHDA